jgi:hypothetical protein
MDGILGWLVKLLFIVMLAPFGVVLATQLVAGVAVAMMPWLLIHAAVTGLFGGIGMAIVLRRRLPPAQRRAVGAGAPPSGQYRVRRPKGGRRLEED